MTKGLLINNEWLMGSGELLTSTHPVTGEVLWQGQSSNHGEVDSAIKAARKAFGDWSYLNLSARKEILLRFARAVTHHKETLATLIAKETGKPLWEAQAEVLAMIGKVDISIQAYDERTPTKSTEVQGARHSIRHKPHGVMVVLGPYNFPAHLPNGHIVPALLAGNTVVFKPSEQTPAVGEFMTQLWIEAGCPPGVMNLVQGAAQTGKALVEHREIDGILFTGSYTTGRWLHELCAISTRKILALEMGGNNPLLVFETSSIDAAVIHTIQSAFITSGQRCTCARRLIVPKDAFGEQFIERLVERSAVLKIADPLSVPQPFLGSVISPQIAQQLLVKQENLLAQGGESLLKMSLQAENTGMLSPGIVDMTSVVSRQDDEIFGPLLQIIRVDSFSAAIEEANNTHYGLSAGLIADDKSLYEQFYRYARAGIINWNRPLTGASSRAPFGGIGHSGNHHPSAYYAADYSAYPVASIETDICVMPDDLPPGI